MYIIGLSFELVFFGKNFFFKIRLMAGEKNFNWRFVHNFLYFPAERYVSIKKKKHFWSLDATELIISPVLNLQIWDDDKFTPDDFLSHFFSFFIIIELI
jgi:hypothetical protein